MDEKANLGVRVIAATGTVVGAGVVIPVCAVVGAVNGVRRRSFREFTGYMDDNLRALGYIYETARTGRTGEY